MSDHYKIKTEQQTYAEIGKVVADFFVANGFNDWAESVTQWGQPSMQELPSPCILMNIEESNKYGWVATRYIWDKTTQLGSATISWYKQIRMAFTFFKDSKELLSEDFDLDSYISPLDMAEKLRAYILSDFGVIDFKQIGYGTKNIGVILNPTIDTDENIYARTPNFTITFVYQETIKQEYPDFKTYEQQKQEFKTNKTIKLIGV